MAPKIVHLLLLLIKNAVTRSPQKNPSMIKDYMLPPVGIEAKVACFNLLFGKVQNSPYLDHEVDV